MSYSSQCKERSRSKLHTEVPFLSPVGCNLYFHSHTAAFLTLVPNGDDQTKHDLWSMYHATIAAQHLGLDISQKGILDKVLDLVDTDGSVRCVGDS